MRKWMIAINSILVLSLLCICAYAHPGRTDDEGGHTDHSTGEYHYHHGYSAHDHYDSDGDGDLDCPYDFEDRTGENSGSNSNGTSNKVTSKVSSAKAATENSEKEDKKVPTWVYWIFAAQSIISIALFISNRIKREEIECMTITNQNALDAMKQTYEEQITKKNATDRELEQIKAQIVQAKKEKDQVLRNLSNEQLELSNVKKIRCRMKNAPLDVSFSKNGMPVYWKPNMSKPYGDYTVYISEKGRVYHTDRLCASYRASESHIFHVIGRYRPCKKCAEGFYDFDSVPDWYSAREDR